MCSPVWSTHAHLHGRSHRWQPRPTKPADWIHRVGVRFGTPTRASPVVATRLHRDPIELVPGGLDLSLSPKTCDRHRVDAAEMHPRSATPGSGDSTHRLFRNHHLLVTQEDHATTAHGTHVRHGGLPLLTGQRRVEILPGIEAQDRDTVPTLRPLVHRVEDLGVEPTPKPRQGIGHLGVHTTPPLDDLLMGPVAGLGRENDEVVHRFLLRAW